MNNIIAPEIKDILTDGLAQDKSIALNNIHRLPSKVLLLEYRIYLPKQDIEISRQAQSLKETIHKMRQDLIEIIAKYGEDVEVEFLLENDGWVLAA